GDLDGTSASGEFDPFAGFRAFFPVDRTRDDDRREQEDLYTGFEPLYTGFNPTVFHYEGYDQYGPEGESVFDVTEPDSSGLIVEVVDDTSAFLAVDVMFGEDVLEIQKRILAEEEDDDEEEDEAEDEEQEAVQDDDSEGGETLAEIAP
ncbi:MAG: hypothetical protein WD342_05995, partial [Verrucomicrobiales bacterium]